MSFVSARPSRCMRRKKTIHMLLCSRFCQFRCYPNLTGLLKGRTWAKLITLHWESAKRVPKMKSLILFLFLGATVALAEIHVGNGPYRCNHHTQGLVSWNSFLSFFSLFRFFVANFLKQSAYGNFYHQQSECASSFQWASSFTEKYFEMFLNSSRLIPRGSLTNYLVNQKVWWFCEDSVYW